MQGRIYMLAHFGDFNKKPIDGGQTSARRFLDTLKKLGYEVNVINRRSKTSNGAIVAKTYAALWGVWAFIHFSFCLLLGLRKNSISLSICYCGSMMPFDSLTAKMAKTLGYKHVMYIKGGRTKPQYENGTALYKKQFKAAITASSLILTEREENVALCKSLCDTAALYFPNYTEDGFAPETLPEKPKDVWNFIYFGRICSEKNTLLTIDIFNALSQYLQNTHLYIIGKGHSDYVQLVKTAIENSLYHDRIELLPVMRHDDLKCCLKNQHFFIFPSSEPNEGHSNSLNEAMAWGVVPVVNNNNFLPSIVGDERFVVTTNEAEEYVNIVRSIIDSGMYNSYSSFVFNRVKAEFTQIVVENKLDSALNILI